MSLPFSVYYHSELKFDQQRVHEENRRLANEAERTLREFTQEKLDLINRTVKDPEFCFVIPSVSRPGKVRYLTQVVAALLPQITDSDVFMVLNAEGPEHTEAKNLSSTVHVEIVTNKRVNIYMKEKEDYIYGLEWCLKNGAKFSVILEDDVLPPSDFVHRLKFVLQFRMPSDRKKWAFLKLYYPEKWEGWSNEPRIVLELIATAFFGGTILTSSVYVFQLVLVRTLPNKVELFIVGLLSSAFMLYALFTLGRPHWLSLRKWSPHLSSVVSSPGCCTPAVVYPQAHLSDLIEYLRNAESTYDFAKDLVLDKFAGERGLAHLLVVPNMVKHIGFVSSLGRSDMKRPQDFRLK